MIDSIKDKILIDRANGKKSPVYKQIHIGITELISKENLPDGYSLPTVAELANILGVNYRTAKLAYEMLVADEFIRYVPNKGAVVNNKAANQSEAGVSKGIFRRLAITFIRPRMAAAWLEMASGVSDYCKENDIDLTVIDALGSHSDYLEALKCEVRSNEGLLVVPYELPEYNKAIESLMAKEVKFVFMDRYLEGVEASVVAADHFGGVYGATCHLLETHDRPAYYLGQSMSPSSSRSWYEGWKAAMVDHGYGNLVDSYVYTLKEREAELFGRKWHCMEDNTQLGLDFLRMVKRGPCSVFVSGDYLANGLYLAANELGFEVGKDLFVVGFGNVPMGQKLQVPLTSVDQNSRQVGYKGAELLSRHMNGQMNGTIKISCETKLHIRASSVKHG